MKMSNRNDKDFIRPHLVYDTIRKPIQAVTSRAAPERLPCIGKIGDLSKTCMKRVNELVAQSFSRIFVPLSSFVDFSERRGLDPHFHGLRG